MDLQDKDELTIRDKFAIAALQGLLSRKEFVHELQFADHCYQIADKMLEKRNEKKKSIK